MPARPRKETVRLGEVALYHCWSRCVRQAFLCGQDTRTGKDYEYRREWIRDFEEQLAGLFGIEVGFHTQMGNHLHLVLRTRPDVVDSWSDESVVERWLKISRVIKSRDGEVRAVSKLRKIVELARLGRVRTLRERLADPSYFMAALCEHVARRSNREEGCSGRFWDDRYKCRELTDEASLLVCGIYVDLNQIRAGEAVTPESSTHTSAYDRICGRRTRCSAGWSPEKAARLPDGWLCELTINERLAVNDPSMLTSATGRRASDRGLLSIKLDDYLALLDATGRLVREGKGAIPGHLVPILERLEIQTEHWLELICNYQEWFGHIVGKSQTLAERARQAGRHWYRGRSHCAAAFG